MNKNKIIKCNLSKKELHDLGVKTAIEWCLHIDKYELYVNDGKGVFSTKFFGIYRLFSCETQQFYSNSEDIYYIIGMYKFLTNNINKISDMISNPLYEKAKKIAIEDEFSHVKNICKILNIKYPDNIKSAKSLEKYLEDNKYMDISNYFYDTRMGYCTKYYHEFLLGIRK